MSDSFGNFVVTWVRTVPIEEQTALAPEGFGSDSDVYARRFAANGSPLGAEFLISSYSTGDQGATGVSMNSAGEFVVVWESEGSVGDDDSSRSIQGRRFASTGLPLGAQFQVNSYTTSFQKRPDVDFTGGGEFVVTWGSDGSAGDDSEGYSVQARRFAADGSPLGADFQVNTLTVAGQRYSVIAGHAGGGFTIVWNSLVSAGTDTDSRSIQARRFDASGSAVGPEFQVNSFTPFHQHFAHIGSNPHGESIVVWNTDVYDGQPGVRRTIRAQRLSGEGTPIGGEFQVESDILRYRYGGDVGIDQDGDFVVAWQSRGSDGTDNSEYSIQGRRFFSNGASAGEQFQANSLTEGWQQLPKISVDPSGDFVIAWQSSFQVGEVWDLSIQARRFRVTGDLRGRAFHDVDGDGVQDAGEPGVAGVGVELYDAQQTLRRSTVTDSGGDYVLKPKEGSWTVKFVPPGPAYGFTVQDAGGDDTLDSDADQVTGVTPPFPISINVLDDSVDVGLILEGLFADGFESGDLSAWSPSGP